LSNSEQKDLLTFRIPENLEGQRLDKALASHPLIGSRSKAAQLIENGSVHKKQSATKIKASMIARTGEEYQIVLPPPEPVELIPLDLDLDIVFEDEHLLVINKPAGLVVHPAAGHAQDTLVNALIHKIENFSMGFGEKRPGIVHRLDKDTSGLLVVAKNDGVQAHLVSQFKARTVSRLYRAIVLGVPKKKEDVIESLLARHPKQRKKFASVRANTGSASTGKKAITHYKTIRTYSTELSLLECRLKTGRTHQIRIHMSELGHPLVGDKLYGNSSRENKLRPALIKDEVLALDRLGLHAAELGFIHPVSGKDLFFRAPWPKDLLSLLKVLGWSDVE
jgi:23S rRNA pseudouridine1911/1915/1917 synthase